MDEARSLSRIIREDEFALKLTERSQRFFALGRLLARKRELSQKYYSNLEDEVHSLETFLDDYRARGNAIFVYFAELVTSMRWFSKTVYTLKHIFNRYRSYGLEENKRFFLDLKETVEFCNVCLTKLYQATQVEASSLGIKKTRRQVGKKEFAETMTEEYLVQNIDEIYSLKEEEKVTEVTFKYADAAERLAELLQETNLTEDRVEELMSSFHRIQSKYDSYIKGSEKERNDGRLPRLRGYISICLHLLEIALYLSHLYEIYQSGEKIGQIKARMAEFVRLKETYQKVSLVLSYTKEYALGGIDTARELLKDYADMTLAREHILIPKGSTLHLRPASALVEPVIQCNSPVLLQIDKQRVRANSVLEVLVAMGEVADKIEEKDIEMVLQGDKAVVKKMKENFLSKILEVKK